MPTTYISTWTVVNHRQQGCPCSIRTKTLVQIVTARIQWNPATVVAWELNISKMFMSGVLRSDLGLKAYKQNTSHFLKEQRVIKSKCHFQRYADRISFHRWKYLEYWGGFQSINWLTLSLNISRKVWRGSRDPERPSSCFCHDFVGGLSYDVTTKLQFCEKEVKISAKVYENTMFEPVVKLFDNTLFSNEHWSFKLDLVPACKANCTKVWLQGIFRTQLLWVIPGLLALQQL